MKRKSRFLFFAIITIVVLTFMTGCDTKGKSYFNKVSAYSFWDNDSSESIAQYKLYDIMNNYLSENIVDGKSVGNDGKTRKVLFLG